MDNNLIRRNFYSKNTKFFGRMYGQKYINKEIKELDRIIEIDKKAIKFCKNVDGFYYAWGWPGPDANIYYFKDYGETWAFNLEDFKE